MSIDTIKMPKRFDYTSGAEFNAAISSAAQQHQVITLDCSNMDYLDSAGIGLLVMANKKVQDKNAKLVMVNLNTAPREILQLANLQKLIEIR
jgi:anti-anti-sigma factor